jgi:hypothetical protein
MARTPRQLPPSAIDGYRRLARTRGASNPDATDGHEATPPSASRPRRLRWPSGHRIAGSLRLLAFVAVLATIVSTSVTLASADPADESQPVVSGTTVESTPEPIAPVAAEPAPAEAAAPARSLPITGVLDVPRMLLLGSLLVLVGMLVQVAGQPLPARAPEHRRTR